MITEKFIEFKNNFDFKDFAMSVGIKGGTFSALSGLIAVVAGGAFLALASTCAAVPVAFAAALIGAGAVVFLVSCVLVKTLMNKRQSKAEAQEKEQQKSHTLNILAQRRNALTQMEAALPDGDEGLEAKKNIEKEKLKIASLQNMQNFDAETLLEKAKGMDASTYKDYQPHLKMHEPDYVRSAIIAQTHKDNDLKERITSQGEKVKMSHQFYNDLSRAQAFFINGQLSCTNILAQDLHDCAATYQQMIQECSKGRDPAVGAKIAERAARCMQQALLADILCKLYAKSIENGEPTIQILNGDSNSYHFTVNKHQVVIVIKQSLTLTDLNLEEDDIKTEENQVIVKRTIMLPIDELAHPNLETMENPLPNMTLTDLYSPLLTDAQVKENFASF